MDEPALWLVRAPITTYRQGVQPWTGPFNVSVGVTTHHGYRRWNKRNSKADASGYRYPTTFNAFRSRVTPKSYDYVSRNWLGALWRRWGERVSLPPQPLDHFIVHQGSGVNSKRFPVIYTDMWDRCQTECIAKASRRKWNIAQTALEMDKSVGTVVQRFSKLVRALLLIKKGRFAQAYKEFGVRGYKDKGGIWLEYQYGWKPLVSDLSNAMEAYNKGSVSDTRARFSTTRLIKEELPLPSFSYIFHVYGKGHRQVHARMDWKVRSQDWDRLKQIGYADPLTLGWELLPFSFVVDWLVPVGTFLEALNATVGLTYMGGSITGKVESNYTFISHTVDEYVSGLRPETTVENVAIERRIVNRPIPQIYVKWPFSSANRAASAVSLFLQLRK